MQRTADKLTFSFVVKNKFNTAVHQKWIVYM